MKYLVLLLFFFNAQASVAANSCILSVPSCPNNAANSGTFTDTYYGFGTFRGYSVGKTRNIGAFEADGIFVGEGLRNHMTAQCIGMAERLDDQRRSSGRCVLTDPGDQIAVEGIKYALTADPAWRDGYFAEPPVRGLRAMGRIYAGWALSQAFYREELWRTVGFSSLEDFLIAGWEANEKLSPSNPQAAFGPALTAKLQALYLTGAPAWTWPAAPSVRSDNDSIWGKPPQ